MKNLRPLMKRVCAYMLDIIIVMILATLISSIPFLSKNAEKYQQKYNEYVKEYEKYTGIQTLLQELYEDSEISEEEYNELIKEELYAEMITTNYEDKKISQGEYKKIMNQINEDFYTMTENYNYELGKIAISDSLITIITTLLYFGVFQYFLKGQTVGKRLLKLKVVSASNKKINIINYILRSLIVNNVLLNVVGIIFLAYATKTVYLQVDNILNTLVSIIEAVIIFLVMTREDGRGLHDMLFNTKVISTDSTSNESTETVDKEKNKVIEADYKEVSDKDGKKEKKSRKRKKQ